MVEPLARVQGTHRVRLNPAAGVVPRMSGGGWVLATLGSAINWAACRPSEGVVRNGVCNSEGGDALGAKEEAK